MPQWQIGRHLVHNGRAVARRCYDSGQIGARHTIFRLAVELTATVRIDTPQDFEYYRHGGILHYVLRQLASE